MELKTNEDGKTMIDVLPTGSKVLVQVIAKGFKTFGGEYTLDKPEMSIRSNSKARPAIFDLRRTSAGRRFRPARPEPEQDRR